MRVAQRILLIMTIITLLLSGTSKIYGEREEKLQEQWESVQTEYFLRKICRSGRLSWEDYMQFHSVLNYRGCTTEIRVEEYREEQDIIGETYFFLVSWEELQECFLEEGRYSFEQGSVIQIVVERQSMGNSAGSSYYGIISGKEWTNDT